MVPTHPLAFGASQQRHWNRPWRLGSRPAAELAARIAALGVAISKLVGGERTSMRHPSSHRGLHLVPAGIAAPLCDKLGFDMALLLGIARGVDRFDHMLPTRLAQTGTTLPGCGCCLVLCRPLAGMTAYRSNRVAHAPPVMVARAPTSGTFTWQNTSWHTVWWASTTSTTCTEEVVPGTGDRGATDVAS